VEMLRDLPSEKSIAAGVIDVRSLEIEAPEQVASRIRKVLEHVPAERVTLTTDCGMKQLPRFCASNKLKALVQGANIVRAELGSSSSNLQCRWRIYPHPLPCLDIFLLFQRLVKICHPSPKKSVESLP